MANEADHRQVSAGFGIRSRLRRRGDVRGLLHFPVLLIVSIIYNFNVEGLCTIVVDGWKKAKQKKSTPWVVEIALMQQAWTVRLCGKNRYVSCAFVWDSAPQPDNIGHVGVAWFSVQRLSSLSITYCHPPATHRARCRCSPFSRTWRDSALSTRSLFSKYCAS